MAAECGQQLAMLRPEVVAGVNAEAASGPGQRRRGVVLRGQDSGHREAVHGGQAGSFRQRDVRVGIALGDQRFIHAPSKGGRVRIDSLAAAPYAKRFLGARRIIPDP